MNAEHIDMMKDEIKEKMGDRLIDEIRDEIDNDGDPIMIEEFFGIACSKAFYEILSAEFGIDE